MNYLLRSCFLKPNLFSNYTNSKSLWLDAIAQQDIISQPHNYLFYYLLRHITFKISIQTRNFII